MVYSIFDSILIILLTVVGIVTGNMALVLLMSASLLMIFRTYGSLSENENKMCNALEWLTMLCMGISGGSFACYSVFMLKREATRKVRLFVMFFSYLVISFLRKGEESVAVILANGLLLVGLSILLLLADYAIAQWEKKKAADQSRILASNVNEMHERRLNEQLVMQNYLAEKNARLVERENISRNIHNSVGHSITAAIMTLDAADMLYEVRPEEARKKMNDANERIRGSLESIRRAVRVLDEESTFIPAADMKSEMEGIINEFVMDTPIKVEQHFEKLPDEIRIPHDHAVFLTGVLQEFLTNGQKHGHADSYVVILMGDSAHIRLEVVDNGKSDFDRSNEEGRIQKGFGLKKMITYAQRCGGKASFVNENGFHGMVELPIVIGE